MYINGFCGFVQECKKIRKINKNIKIGFQPGFWLRCYLAVFALCMYFAVEKFYSDLQSLKYWFLFLTFFFVFDFCFFVCVFSFLLKEKMV